MRILFISFISVFFVLQSIAQGSNMQLQKKEDQLIQLLSKLRSTKENKAIDKINKQFKDEFKKVLEIEGAFEYPFSSLKTIGDIRSDDKLVRIFSWNVQYEDLSNNYFSFVLKKDDRRGGITVIELERQDQHIRLARNETVEANNWYGALYYDIIDIQRRNRTFYTLLGYDFNNKNSTIKFIDVLYFSGSTPHFGYPLFKDENERSKREIFEYSSEAVMSLKYDPQRELIIFDHLSPKSSKLKEFKEFYVPDMSYDAYIWDGKYWNLEEDIIANNSALTERKKVELKAYDEDMDTVVSIEKKSSWINPTDLNAPIDAGQHRAVTPEDIKDEKGGRNSNKVDNRRKKTVQPPRRSKSKPNGVSYSHLNKRIDKKNKKKKRKDKRKKRDQ